jgi:Fe-S cluster assembly protein SufD
MSTITTHTTAVQTYLQEAQEFADRFGTTSPEWMAFRRAAADVFAKTGFPTTKHEEWKYLNFSSLQSGGFRTASPNDVQRLESKDAAEFRLAGTDAALIVIENGKLNTAASTLNALPAGIRVGGLDELGHLPEVQAHLYKHAAVEGEPFVAHNTMLSFSPVIVLVEKKAKVQQPVQLAMVAMAGMDAVCVPVRILVVAEEQSECTIMESYHTHGNGLPIFTNSVTETVIGKAAVVHYSKVQVENDSTTHVAYHKVHHARDSYQHLTTLTLGGSLVRNNLHIRLDDEQINSYLYGLYVVNGSQVVDNHTLVDHAMPNCHSNELYKGIIDEQGQGVFNGKIWVRQDAQKTNAYQSNKNLLLSNEASMNTKPQLEIYADDVKCSHGATTGQLDEEALFYLRARGIGEANARALLNHAFAADVINQVENESIRESLMVLLDGKLS